MTTLQKCLLWLDCDPGVDDAYAIILSAHSSEFKLIGVSSVVGNASLQTTTNNALKMLWAVGQTEVPVAKGSDNWLFRNPTDYSFWDERDTPEWSTGFDSDVAINSAFLKEHLSAVEENGIYFMYQRIKAQLPQRVSIITTGPLTNVALLIKTFPDVKSAIERIVFMGGSLKAGNVNPSAEANVWCDPEACELVLRSGLPVTMVPLDLTHQVRFTPEAISILRNGHNPDAPSRFIEFALDLFRIYLRHHPTAEGGVPAVHDPCAVAWLLDEIRRARDPHYCPLFTSSRMHVQVDLQ